MIRFQLFKYYSFAINIKSIISVIILFLLTLIFLFTKSLHCQSKCRTFLRLLSNRQIGTITLARLRLIWNRSQNFGWLRELTHCCIPNTQWRRRLNDRVICQVKIIGYCFSSFVKHFLLIHHVLWYLQHFLGKLLKLFEAL